MTAPDNYKLVTLLYTEYGDGYTRLEWFRNTDAAWQYLSGYRDAEAETHTKDFDPKNMNHRRRLIEDLDECDMSWMLRETAIDTDILERISNREIPEVPETINTETLSQFSQWQLVEMLLAHATLPEPETTDLFWHRGVLNALDRERLVDMAVSLLTRTEEGKVG